MVRDRLYNKNLNWVCSIAGELGSSKSYSALTLCSAIDPSFRPRGRVVFNVNDFIELISSGRLKKGNAILFDEAGVGMAARDWNSVQNKIAERMFQIFRTDNLAVVITMPLERFLDTNIRALVGAKMISQGIDRTRNRAQFKFYEMYYNNVEDEYCKRIPFWHGKSLSLQFFHKPPHWMTKEYDQMRNDYKKKRDIVSTEALTQGKQPKIKNPTKADLIRKDYKELGMTPIQLARKYKTSGSYVSHITGPLKE